MRFAFIIFIHIVLRYLCVHAALSHTECIVNVERAPTPRIQALTEDGCFMKQFGAIAPQQSRAVAVDRYGQPVAIEGAGPPIIIFLQPKPLAFYRLQPPWHFPDDKPWLNAWLLTQQQFHRRRRFVSTLA